VNEDRIPLRDALARAAVPLAALAAMAALAGREVDPVAAAETAYLALLATAGLLAVAFLAPAPAWEAGIGAALATTLVWGLPAGPGRGAAVVLLLVAVLAVATGRRWFSSFESLLSLESLLPLSLGLQILLRGGELLFQAPASPRTLVILLALPTAGALATAVLARRHGPLALIAAGTAVLLAPGWNVATTLGLAALAAGDLLARPQSGRIAKAAALLVILAPIAWNPAPGLAAAVTALALARPREGPFVALAVAAGLAVFTMRDPAWSSTVWLPFLLLPASLFPDRDRSWAAVAGLALALAVPRSPDLSAMAAPLALLALGGGSPLPAGREGVGEGLGVRGLWTATLLAATCLLAAYPWLRPEPLIDALGFFGLALTPFAVIVAIAAAGALVLLSRLRLAPAAPAAVLLFFAACVHIPAPGTSFLPPATAMVVDAAHPVWSAALGRRAVGTIVLESSLSNGAALSNGRPVAVVRLRDGGGRISEQTLRAGVETGEWAARRPDVAASSVLKSPQPWISWVAGDFFGQRYRSLWEIQAPGPFTALSIERSPGLPPQVSLAVHLLEVRP
jgi:hypothetical protein